MILQSPCLTYTEDAHLPTCAVSEIHGGLPFTAVGLGITRVANSLPYLKFSKNFKELAPQLIQNYNLALLLILVSDRRAR
jgi:hypothetical protein